MSTRDKVIRKIGLLNEEQLEGLLAFLNCFVSDDEFNDETLKAFAEVEEMKKHPEQYKGYTDVDDLFDELHNDK